MTTIQKLFSTVLPKSWAESMEKESREWIMKCEECGNETSVWDAGGIRWKASGNPSRKLKCRSCNKFGWHKTYRKESAN